MAGIEDAISIKLLDEHVNTDAGAAARKPSFLRRGLEQKHGGEFRVVRKGGDAAQAA